MDEVECSVCRKACSRRRSRGVYVGERGVQYVCFSCRKLPFEEVMDARAVLLVRTCARAVQIAPDGDVAELLKQTVEKLLS